MENAVRKTDRRVIKTKKAIRNAFIILLSQKKMSQISIKELAETADINRKTFYNYYTGIHQIVDEIEDELVGNLNSILTDMDIRSKSFNPYDIFEKLTHITNGNDELNKIVLSDSNTTFIVKIIASLKENIKRTFVIKSSLGEATTDFTVEFLVSGMLAVYRDWYNTGKKGTIEELSRTVGILAFKGVNGILETEENASGFENEKRYNFIKKIKKTIDK